MIILTACVAFLAALVLSLVLTRLMIWLGPRLGLIDVPDGDRRIHSEPIPRAGGIGLWIAFVVSAGCVLASLPVAGALRWDWFIGFIFASGILVAIGVIDDRWGLSAWVKLAGQVGVAVFLFFGRGTGVGTLLGVQVPWGLDLLVWVVWTVGIINAFNLIDGMDGLCAGLATISMAALAVLSFTLGKTTDGIVMLTMIGGLMGFLMFNFHPARIFLGDAGSMLIGLVIASAATASAGERAVAVSLLVPLLVAGVPLLDLLLAVWRRSARRMVSGLGVDRMVKVFGADKEHLHHRLLDGGLNQRNAALMLYALALIGAVLVLIPSLFDNRALGITIPAVFVAGLFGLRNLASVELHASGRVVQIALKRPRAARMIALGYYLYDVLVILFALTIAMMLEYNGEIPWSEGSLPAAYAITVACGLIGLRLARAQARLWGRAAIRDFWALIIWFAVSIQVAFTLTTFVAEDLAWSYARIFLFTGAIAIALFVVPRSVTTLVRESLLDTGHRRRSRSKQDRKRLVLYGAGDLGELFLSHLKATNAMKLDGMEILGFIDDHPNLRGRIFDGFRIFGSAETLPELEQKYHLHGVIISARMLRPESADRLNQLAESCGLTLYHWGPNLSVTELGAGENLGQPVSLMGGRDGEEVDPQRGGEVLGDWQLVKPAGQAGDGGGGG